MNPNRKTPTDPRAYDAFGDRKRSSRYEARPHIENSDLWRFLYVAGQRHPHWRSRADVPDRARGYMDRKWDFLLSLGMRKDFRPWERPASLDPARLP